MQRIRLIQHFSCFCGTHSGEDSSSCEYNEEQSDIFAARTLKEAISITCEAFLFFGLCLT